MSQDFLREYVLFPVVSPQIFTVQILVCLCVARRHTFLCHLCASSLCIPEWQAENSLKTRHESDSMDWDKALVDTKCIELMKYHLTLGKLPALVTFIATPPLFLFSPSSFSLSELADRRRGAGGVDEESCWGTQESLVLSALCRCERRVRKKKCKGNDLLSEWYSICLCFPVECRLLKQSCCTSRRWRNWTALARRAFLLR